MIDWSMRSTSCCFHAMLDKNPYHVGDGCFWHGDHLVLPPFSPCHFRSFSYVSEGAQRYAATSSACRCIALTQRQRSPSHFFFSKTHCKERTASQRWWRLLIPWRP